MNSGQSKRVHYVTPGATVHDILSLGMSLLRSLNKGRRETAVKGLFACSVSNTSIAYKRLVYSKLSLNSGQSGRGVLLKNVIPDKNCSGMFPDEQQHRVSLPSQAAFKLNNLSQAISVPNKT